MNVLETFKQFLLDKGCLESYIYYLEIDDYLSLDEYNNVNRFIIDAFCWDLTKEGNYFWSIKDDEWKRIAKNYDPNVKHTFVQILKYLNTEVESLWTD